VQPLAASARYRESDRSWQGVRFRNFRCGATALDPRVLGRDMTGAVQFGPHLTSAGVTFRLWAPAARRVDLVLDRDYPMQAMGAGWYEATIAGAGASTLYKFRIDGELEVPDPASHFQPQDV